MPAWAWDRRDRVEIGTLLGVVTLMHLAGFATLVLVIAPHRYQSGTEVVGIGLGVTAYLLGLRHAFDADHIAAIDNTARKLLSDNDGDSARRKPISVGFWFAMGHSSVVFLMAVLVAVGARAVGVLVDDGSPVRHALGLAGTLASGLFLYLIALANIVALTGISLALGRLRRGSYSDEDLDAALDGRGLLTRVLRPVMRRIQHPAQLYPVGVLFGLGFDTATEIALLALAGGGAGTGLPWQAVLVLPLLFAAGMTLLDTVDGLLMTAAYGWAFRRPGRKIYYNFTITALSVAVALLIGTVELVSILHDDLHWSNPLTDWLSGISLYRTGLVIVGLFGITWLVAIGYRKFGNVQRRWQVPRSVD
ncbi:MAG TPA: HoxN/HupN/NixA family nickel/cobalt transporter [Mycobacterium sp.]|nr:HoxN/HupN/NixA family nickel/cobalt transporter [Mycobacterium sp.]